MRQGTNNRRSRGRGGRKQPSGRFHTFDSNGPNGRLRGNAHQLYEKYLTLGRDAAGAGDRITAENLFQHAEHYFRIMNANGADGTQRPRFNGEGEQPDLDSRIEAGAGQSEPDEVHAQPEATADSESTETPPASGGNGKVRRRKRGSEPDSETVDTDQPVVS
jgi:hypothetical protein